MNRSAYNGPIPYGYGYGYVPYPHGYVPYRHTPSLSYGYVPYHAPSGYGYGLYSHTPSGYGYPSFTRGRTARERRTRRAREAVGLHTSAGLPDTRLPYYSSYFSDDPHKFSYGYRTHSYTPDVDEDSGLRTIRERARQLQLDAKDVLKKRREAELDQELAEHVDKPQEPEPISTSAPCSSILISSPKVSPSASPDTEPTQLPKYPFPPPSPESATPEATPEEIRAAMTIQEFYRRRLARKAALASIDDLSIQFEKVKSIFSPPPYLDYNGPTPNDTISIAAPSESFTLTPSTPPPSEDTEDTIENSKSSPDLAFTSNNKVVHGYIENLNRLLIQLDRVESGGDALVREQRKQMIENVEGEAQRIDRWIETVWNLAQPETPG